MDAACKYEKTEYDKKFLREAECEIVGAFNKSMSNDDKAIADLILFNVNDRELEDVI